MSKEIARKMNSLSKLKKCRKCLSANLLRMAPDVFCLDCDWNSVAYYVSIGAMDNFRAAAGEHGFISRNHNQLLKNENSQVIESNSVDESDTIFERVAV